MYLNCYSKVTLKPSVPVLHEVTAKIPKTFGTTKTFETAKYCQMLDQFFDCLSVRKSLQKHKKEQAISETVH